VFIGLLRNLGSPTRSALSMRNSARYGLGAGRHDGSVQRCAHPHALRESTSIFRVLIKTLLKAGIITERTRGVYAAYVDMEELLQAESDRMIGDDIAEEGIKYLMTLNGGAVIARAAQRDNAALCVG
jgi:hypothetical protein